MSFSLTFIKPHHLSDEIETVHYITFNLLLLAYCNNVSFILPLALYEKFPNINLSGNLYTTNNNPLRSVWNIGPQQLSVAEVSVALKFFIETGLLALCSNPQPGGPGLHIYIPCCLQNIMMYLKFSKHYK
jgi:hypothetical protein